MTIVESVVGNAHDPVWQAKLSGLRLDYLALDQREAQKTRFRKTSQAGVELAISVEREVLLRDGDVLLWNEAEGVAVVARIFLCEVMVIRLDGLLAAEPEALASTAVELGRALGIQHCTAVAKGTQIFVPLTVDRIVMASIMRAHAFRDISYDFVPGSNVTLYMAPNESRRLFGGIEGRVATFERCDGEST